MSSIKKVAQNTTLYFLSSLILRASSIIFFPIFSFYLTKEDYGILFVTQSVTAVLLSFSALEIHRAVTRFIYDKNILAGSKEIFALGMKLSVLSNILWAGLLLMLGTVVLKPILNDIDFYPYMAVATIAIVFTSIADNYREFLKAQHKGKASFMFELAYYGTNIGLNLVFVVLFRMNVIGLIYSTLISGIIFSFYIGYDMFPELKKSINIELGKQMLRYSFPLIPFTLLGLLLTTTDRFLLNSFIGKEASGLFYIAFTMAAIFSTIKEAMYASFTPWFYEHFTSDNYSRIRKMINYFLTGSALLCIGISLFSYEILYVLSSKVEFVEAWKYVPFITTGFLIVFAGQLISLPIFHSKKTKYFFLSNLGGFITVAVLGYLFVMDYGIYGILIAKILGFLVMLVIQYALAVSVSDFKINRLYASIVLGMSFALSFLHYLPLDYVVLLVIKLALVLSLSLTFMFYLKRTYFKEQSYIGIFKQFISSK